MMTFNELCADLRLKPDEREALVFYLAAIRARETVRALLTVSEGQTSE